MLGFAANDSDEFATAQPFPHIVRDGLWDDNELEQITAEFPAVHDPRWQQYSAEQERGKKAGGPHMQGPRTRAWFDRVGSPETCGTLEKLTGITPLIADELGGGMHLSARGARLGLHTDFQQHPEPRLRHLQRRINMLVFLSPNWDPAWGGILYLGAHRDVAVVPEKNRTVIFATSDTSWHGHPDPITGDYVRQSLACYYYSPAEPGAHLADTTTWLT